MLNPCFRSCILFLADGARPDFLEELLGRGDLPNISRHIVAPGSLRRATTVFPSTTGPAYLPFLTGAYPGPCNLPGIRWFDREAFSRLGVWGRRSYRSYVGPGSYCFNKDLMARFPTIFGHFQRPANIFSAINRDVGFFGNVTKAIRSAYWLYAHWTDRWQPVDRAAGRLLNSAIHRRSDFVFAVFPGVDEFSHLKHPFADEVVASYRALDRAVGEAVAALSAQGREEETLLVLTSDHGLTETHRHLDPGDLLDAMGFRTLHYPKVFRPDADAAFMVSGNGMGHVYFRGKTGWGAPMAYEEIRELTPDPVAEFLGREEVDLIASRSQDGGIRVIARAGEARIVERDGTYTYETLWGDPLGYGPLPPELDAAQAHALTVETDYPDGLVQLTQLFEAPRSGDMILSANVGSDLRSCQYENPDHRASHGSLHREHMQVPLAMNVPVRGDHPRTVDLFPTILKLTGRPVPEGLEGEIIVAS